MEATAIQPTDVVYYAAISLDGYIAGKHGDVSWLDGYFIPELGFHDFIARIKGTIMGRATFDKIASFGKWPYGETPGFIATNRPIDLSFGPVFVAPEVQRKYCRKRRNVGRAHTGLLAARIWRHNSCKAGC